MPRRIPLDPRVDSRAKAANDKPLSWNESALKAYPVRVNPAVHSTQQEIYHDSNVDSVGEFMQWMS
jgi:hypothetical protein